MDKKPRRLEIDDGKPPAWTKGIAKAPIRLGRLRDVMVHAAQENRVTAPGRQVRGSLAGANDRNVVEARGDGFSSNIRDVFLPNLSSEDLSLRHHPRRQLQRIRAVTGANVGDVAGGTELEDPGETIRLP